MRLLGVQVGRMGRPGKVPGAGFDYYINSVSGSDSNNGRSPSQAWATLGKLVSASALRNGVKIGLARGSTWREELNTTAYSNVLVGAYGTGRKPILAADDVRASFNKTNGFTNIYETPWTPLGTAGKSTPTIYRNGVLLTRVASQATCDSTPGSFYASNSGLVVDTPSTLYFHAPASANPNSDGGTWEVAVRQAGIRMGNDSIVRNIRARRNLNNDGSIVLGTNALIEDCIAEDGHYHNIFINYGTVRRTVAYKADPYCSLFTGAAGTMFVHYYTPAGTPNVLYEDCDAIMPATKVSTAPSGWYGHGGGVVSFGTVTYRRCRAAYCDGAFSTNSTNTTASVVESGLAYECGMGVLLNAKPWTIDKFEYFRETAGTYTYNAGLYAASGTNLQSVTLTNSVIVTRNDGINIAGYGTLVIDNNIIAQLNTVNSLNGVLLGNSTNNSTVTMTDNLFHNWALNANNAFFYASKASGNVLTASNNVYGVLAGAHGDFRLNGTTYNTPGEWFTAVQPGNDTGSTAPTANQFVNALTTRDYSIVGGSNAANQNVGPVGFTPMTFVYATVTAALDAA